VDFLSFFPKANRSTYLCNTFTCRPEFAAEIYKSSGSDRWVESVRWSKRIPTENVTMKYQEMQQTNHKAIDERHITG